MKSKILFIISLLFYLKCSAQTYGWREIGSGANKLNASDAIASICSDISGNMYAAGYFKDSLGQYYVAKWNGSKWYELGIGANSLHADSNIFTLCSDSMGSIYCAGRFTNPNGKAYVAKWNGTNWSELGTGINALNANSYIGSLIIESSGRILATGNFTNTNGKFYVSEWNGIKWSELGSGINGLNANALISAICTDKNGNVYCAGDFKNTSGKYYVAKWNGINWSEVGVGTSLINGPIESICIDSLDNIYIGGILTLKNPLRYYALKWDGVSWSIVGTGSNALNANGDIGTMCTDRFGNVYAAGLFTNGADIISGNKYVAKWDGISWSEIGAGANAIGANYPIYTLCFNSLGNICAAGIFTNLNGKYYVASYEKLLTPTINSSTINITNIDTMSFSVSFNKGNGKKRLIACGLSPITNFPQDNISYNADLNLKLGYKFGNDNWAVYNDTGSNITIKGLEICTKYYISVFEYNYDSAHIWYLINNYLNAVDSTKFHGVLTINSSTGDSTFCNNANFYIIGNNYKDVNYQWYKNGTSIIGANNYTYTNVSSSGLYSLKISKNSCLLNSNNLAIVINSSPSPVKPSITELSKSLLQSTVANSYQWYLNNSIISSATNQTLVITTNGNYSVKIDSTNGCTNTSDPFTASSVGVNEIYANNEIKIYPNPATDELTISFSSLQNEKEVLIEIIDLKGSKLMSINQTLFATRTININLSDLATGMYFVMINNQAYKFVKADK